MRYLINTGNGDYVVVEPYGDAYRMSETLTDDDVDTLRDNLSLYTIEVDNLVDADEFDEMDVQYLAEQATREHQLKTLFSW